MHDLIAFVIGLIAGLVASDRPLLCIRCNHPPRDNHHPNGGNHEQPPAS